MLYTTLNSIHAKSPCREGWEKLLKHLGKKKADDAPLSFETILDSNGIDDTLWCLRVLPSDMDGSIRHLACDFAETVLKYADDPRPAEAIRVARLYADGKANIEELNAARAAAYDAAWHAARADARAAAQYAARDAAWSAASYAASDAAQYAAQAEQAAMLRKWLLEQGC